VEEEVNQGTLKIEWARGHMPVLKALEERLIKTKPFKDLKIAIAIHLEAKTANFALALKEGGADVAITSSNPLSTQDDVADALSEKGVKVYARYGVNEKEYWENFEKILLIKPDFLIDDGGDLVEFALSKYPEIASKIIGACEETTTGVMRDKILEKRGKLIFPIIAVNSGRCKYLFDNRYGTGQSVWDGIIRTTNMNIAGKNVVISGYGWVGKGISMRAKGLGAHTFVTEVDPIKALEAHMDGFTVLPIREAAKIGDIFITCTSNTDIIDRKTFLLLKNGAILANAGHFNVEIAMEELKKIAVNKKEVRKNITEYLLSNSKKIYVLGEGRLVNLACADGHPIEIMDLSFALQLLSSEYLIKKRSKLANLVYNVPEEVDLKVAEMALSSYGIKIDKLTKKQIKYLNV
jgi:adenosylhomocysteinase